MTKVVRCSRSAALHRSSSGIGWASLVLLGHLGAPPLQLAYAVRPSDSTSAQLEQVQQQIDSLLHHAAASGDARATNRQGRSVSNLDGVAYVEGGNARATCEDGATGGGIACDLDEYLSVVRNTGANIDCELAEVQRMLDLTAYSIQNNDNGVELELTGEAAVDLESMKPCDSSCEKCIGQKWFTGENSHMLIVPQPAGSGTAYAYAGDTAKTLSSTEEIEKGGDKEAIAKAIKFATGVSARNALVNAEEFLLSHPMHTRLWYYGHDPAIIVRLMPHKNLGDASTMCVGRPNVNSIDPANLNKFFNTGVLHPLPETKQDFVPPFWSRPRPARGHHQGQGSGEVSGFETTAARTVFNREGKPMGTVALDVSLSSLVTRFLEGMQATPNVYALLVDRQGYVVALTQRARDMVFAENMTEEQILNPHKLFRCVSGGNESDTGHCLLQPSASLSLHDAGNAEKYSGINFSTVLEEMFEADNNCTAGVKQTDLFLPHHVEGHRKTHHKVGFCYLSAVPSWGILFGTPIREIEMAAQIEIDKALIVWDLEKAPGAPMDDVRIETLTLNNTGRVSLPFFIDRFCRGAMVHGEVVSKDEDADVLPGEAKKQGPQTPHFVTIVPNRGVVNPGETVHVNVTVTVANLGMKTFNLGGILSKDRKKREWTYTENLLIRADARMPHGACFQRPVETQVRLTLHKKDPWWIEQLYNLFHEWPKTIMAGAALFFLLICVVGTKVFLHVLRSYLAGQKFLREKVNQSLDSIYDLSHPMVVMKLSDFESREKMISHEEGEELHMLHWLYTVDAIKEFCKLNSIIYLSHQWTAFRSPDPTNIQFKTAMDAIHTLQKQKEWRTENTYIWLDYHSVPQIHRGLQKMAIDSLPTYAANVAAFIVVTPEVKHSDMEEFCNKETFQRRAWNRAEQLAHLLAVGPKSMYVAEGNGLGELTKEWIESSIYVFQGELTCCKRKHVGMDRCDRQQLVTPMIGLWAQMIERCSEAGADKYQMVLYKQMQESINEIFPSHFKYLMKKEEEERELFGCLLELLPETMAKRKAWKSKYSR